MDVKIQDQELGFGARRGDFGVGVSPREWIQGVCLQSYDTMRTKLKCRGARMECLNGIRGDLGGWGGDGCLSSVGGFFLVDAWICTAVRGSSVR